MTLPLPFRERTPSERQREKAGRGGVPAMSETLRRVQALVDRGEYIVSRHGFRELAADDIVAEDAIDGVASAILIEDYPTSRKEPSVLVLQRDRNNQPIHVMWVSPRRPERPPCS